MKKWIIIFLDNLKIKKFGNKDDLHVAINILIQAKRPIEVYKYNESVGYYVQQKIVKK